MIRSMTGFARRERQGPWGTLTCELRTVNHRYLEVSLRLPDELKSAENDARQLIATSLRRGKVDANLYLKSTAGTSPAIEVNDELVGQLLKQVATLHHPGRSANPTATSVRRSPQCWICCGSP
jgi:uncharacterized protein (TIGR00255 family)